MQSCLVSEWGYLILLCWPWQARQVEFDFVTLFLKWFPSRRSTVVGLIVAGFGLGALVFTPIQTALINPSNVEFTSEVIFDWANVLLNYNFWSFIFFRSPEIIDRIPISLIILGSITLFLQIAGLLLCHEKKFEVCLSFINFSFIINITALWRSWKRKQLRKWSHLNSFDGI